MKSKLETLFIILILLLSIANIKLCTDAIVSLSDNTQKRYISQSDIKNNQYLITDEYIARISPKTMVESFVMQIGLEDKEIAIYEDETKEVEIKEGLINTGMILTVREKQENVEEEIQESESEEELQETEEIQENEETEEIQENEETEEIQENEEIEEIQENEEIEEIQENEEIEEKTEEDYKLSVVGDINRDGNANIVEVVQIINHLAGFEGKEITGIELISSDINGDTEVNLIDIDKLIRYIVFEELEIGEVGAPKEPVIEIEGEEIEGWYKDDIKIIINTQEEEFLKTVYTIDEERKETTNRIEEETIRQTGEHKIQAYTYGKNENKSVIAEKEVKIDKEEPAIKNIIKSTEEETEQEVKVEIIAEDNESGLAEEAYSFDGGVTWQKENYKEYETNQEEIKIQVKDKVGNIKEETINIQNIIPEKTKFKVEFKNYDGEILQSGKLEEGVIPKYEGEEPTKVEDETYTYKFAGWDKDITNVNGDQEYIARYEATYKNYTITFKNDDGTTISSKDYHYGDTVQVPEETPTKEQEGYIFTFIGWGKEVTEVKGNQEYIATFNKELINYTIEYDLNGGVVETENPTTYNIETESFTLKNPTKKWYKFVGWTLMEETQLQDNVTIEKGSIGNKKYIANWELEEERIKIEETNKIYASIEMALEDLENEGTIILLKDTNENIVIGENKTITINLNGKTITNTNETAATIINEGTLIIVDESLEQTGQIENINNTAIINNGNLVIGNDDGIIEENTIVKGATNAVQNNGRFYMYDGTLIGKTTIIGNDAIIPEGEEYGLSIKEVDGIQIATIQIIQIPEALVGETYYTTLQQAIDENNNETIYVVKKDIELIDVLTIDETKNLTIDLNGNNISRNIKGYIIENSGTLTITDTNENNKGNISNIVEHAIYNKSALNVKNININSNGYGIHNEKDLDIEYVNIESSTSHGVYNKYSSKDIKFIMLGGNIKGSYGVHNHSTQTNQGSFTIKIEDAIIEGTDRYAFVFEGLYNNQLENQFEISKTTLKSNSCGLSTSNCNYQLLLKDSNIKIENGTYGIHDYSGQGNITLENTEIDIKTNNTDSYGIYNTYGNLDITLENTKINVESNNTSYGIYNNRREGNTTLKNTTINVDSTKTSYGIYNNSDNKVNNHNIVINNNTQIEVNTEAQAYGIYSDIINIDNNEINIEKNIQLIDGNILAIGVKGGYGVKLGKEHFDFFGGTVSANTQTISATIGSIAEGKQIQTIKTDNEYISTLIDAENIEYIASVGAEQFYTLEDAIEYCTNTEEATKITILSDFEQSQSIMISEDKNIIIDLNGKKITSYGKFINEGKLEITDYSTNKLGMIEEKGNIAIFNKENATFTLSGGKINLNNDLLELKNGVYNTQQASVNITDGSIEMVNSGVVLYNESTGKVEISGGTFKMDMYQKNKSVACICNFIGESGGNRNVDVTGGDISISSKDSKSSISIYGIYNDINNSSYNDSSIDIIDLNISDFKINIQGKYSDGICGIYNYSGAGRDIINVNMQNTILEVTKDSNNNREVYGIYNLAKNPTTNLLSGIYNKINEGSVIVSSANGTYSNYYGIYNSGNNINIDIGTEGEYLQIPSITGKTYGIYSSTTNTINFFQGTIKGSSAINENTILNLEEGKEINRYIDEVDNYDTIVIQEKTPKVKIGETEYFSLQEAIDVCQNDSEEFTTIELLSDIDNGVEVTTVNERNKIILDLKGYKITSMAEHTILNNGELNIIDTVDGGEIDNNINNAIGNYGKLSIQNIKINGVEKGVINYKNAFAELEEVEINSKGEGIRNNENANMTINNTEVIVNDRFSDGGVYNYNGNINIIDSQITSSKYCIYNYGNNSNINIKNSNITTNGNFSNTGIYISSGTVNIGEEDSAIEDTTIIKSGYTGVRVNSGNFNYYGGTIESKEIIMQGAINDIPKNKTIYIDEETNTMSLIDKPEENVVQIGDAQYTSLSKAVEAVLTEQEEKTTIKVIKDFDIASYEDEVNIAKNKKISLDLNGHTITSYREYIIKNSGNLEIIDSSELQDGKLISKFKNGIYNEGKFTLNNGTIQAIHYGIYNDGEEITINGGIIEVLGNRLSSSVGIYANGIGSIRLHGGNIKVYSGIEANGNEVMGIYAKNAYIEVDGTEIFVSNSYNNYTYGIFTTNGTIKFKSGSLEVVSNGGGAITGISGEDGGNDIEISGGNIKATSEVAGVKGIRVESYNKASILTMTGGNIEIKYNDDDYNGNYSTGISGTSVNDSTTISILGGMIKATGEAIYADSSTKILLGSKDGNMRRTDPVIEGEIYGINGGIINFYDGTIIGKTAVSQSPEDVEAGHRLSVATNGELQYATLTLVSTAEAIAQIGNLHFDDLQKAINACKTDTIKMLVDTNLSKTLYIEEGQTITIDLNGCTIKGTIENNGILNIINNKGTVGEGSYGTIIGTGTVNIQ